MIYKSIKVLDLNKNMCCHYTFDDGLNIVSNRHAKDKNQIGKTTLQILMLMGIGCNSDELIRKHLMKSDDGELDIKIEVELGFKEQDLIINSRYFKNKKNIQVTFNVIEGDDVFESLDKTQVIALIHKHNKSNKVLKKHFANKEDGDDKLYFADLVVKPKAYFNNSLIMQGIADSEDIVVQNFKFFPRELAGKNLSNFYHYLMQGNENITYSESKIVNDKREIETYKKELEIYEETNKRVEKKLDKFEMLSISSPSKISEISHESNLLLWKKFEKINDLYYEKVKDLQGKKLALKSIKQKDIDLNNDIKKILNRTHILETKYGKIKINIQDILDPMEKDIDKLIESNNLNLMSSKKKYLEDSIVHLEKEISQIKVNFDSFKKDVFISNSDNFFKCEELKKSLTNTINKEKEIEKKINELKRVHKLEKSNKKLFGETMKSVDTDFKSITSDKVNKIRNELRKRKFYNSQQTTGVMDIIKAIVRVIEQNIRVAKFSNIRMPLLIDTPYDDEASGGYREVISSILFDASNETQVIVFTAYIDELIKYENKFINIDEIAIGTIIENEIEDDFFKYKVNEGE